MIRQPLQRGVGIDHIWRLRRPPAGNIGINEFAVGQGLRRLDQHGRGVIDTDDRRQRPGGA